MPLHPLFTLRFFRSKTLLALALCGACLLPLRSGWAAAFSDAEITEKECGACHYAYARDWLPAYSWKQIVDHLDDHFGENATLDDKTRQRILTYLVAQRPTDIPIRVTETDWWKTAHGGGASIETYAEAKGFKVSNCEKCHR